MNQKKTTISEEITELKRELEVRRKVYPDWVVMKKLTNDQAAHRIACLESTIKRLEELQRQQVGSQPAMFDVST